MGSADHLLADILSVHWVGRVVCTVPSGKWLQLCVSEAPGPRPEFPVPV